MALTTGVVRDALVVDRGPVRDAALIGTQALWRLLSAIAYSGEHVSLYEVVSRLDRRNSAAVAAAVAALCEVPA